MATPPTQNLDAYQLYLRGKALFFSLTGSRVTSMQGIDLLEQAVRLDPRFAQGWATLSYAHSQVYHNRDDYTEERLAKAREAADRALALQPDLPEGHRALGYYYYWGRGDYAQAQEEFRIAAGGRGDDAEALEAMAYVMRRQGRWDEAIATMEKAYALNPRKVELVDAMRETYEYMRRDAEAVRYGELGLSLAPDAIGVVIGNVFQRVHLDGNTRAARELLKRLNRQEFPQLPAIECFLDMLDGRFEDALQRIAEIPDDVLETQNFYSPKPLMAGLAYLAMNDRARAQASCESGRQVLEKAIAASPKDARRRMALAQALACLGRKDEAVREARLAADIVPVSSDAVDGPFFQEALARIDVMVGDRDAACDILEKLLSYPSGTHVGYLKLDPDWTPLRNFPRFQKLIAKYS